MIALALCLVLWSACQPKSQQTYENKLQQVLDGHDELMEEMNELNLLITQLEARINAAEEEDVAAEQEALNQLKSVHEAMFDWMHNFGDEFPDISDKEKTFTEAEYQTRVLQLEEQETALLNLQKDFEQAISNAKILLN